MEACSGHDLESIFGSFWAPQRDQNSLKQGNEVTRLAKMHVVKKHCKNQWKIHFFRSCCSADLEGKGTCATEIQVPNACSSLEQKMDPNWHHFGDILAPKIDQISVPKTVPEKDRSKKIWHRTADVRGGTMGVRRGYEGDFSGDPVPPYNTSVNINNMRRTFKIYLIV